MENHPETNQTSREQLQTLDNFWSIHPAYEESLGYKLVSGRLMFSFKISVKRIRKTEAHKKANGHNY